MTYITFYFDKLYFLDFYFTTRVIYIFGYLVTVFRFFIFLSIHIHAKSKAMQKAESQNGSNKKVKYAKFSKHAKTKHFLSPDTHTQGVRDIRSSEIWWTLLSCYRCFEIHLFALLLTYWPNRHIQEPIKYLW